MNNEIVFGTFAVITFCSVVVGWVASKKVCGDGESYYLNNRNLNKWILGLSAGATANSGFIVIGAVGMGYSMGFSSVLYPLAWLIGDLIFWYFFAEKINVQSTNNKAVTIPQMISGSNRRSLLGMITGVIILLLLLVYASAQFTAAGKTLNAFFSINETLAILMTLIIVLSYILWGGFKSSVWTDLMQSVAMLLLTMGVLIWGVSVSGGFLNLHQQINAIDPNFTNLIGERGPLSLFLFLIGFAFAGFGFSMSQPQVTSRIMAGSSPREARQAKWIYIAFLHFTWIGMCIIGMIAKVLMPDLLDGEKALAEIARNYFHPIIIGAVLAGMFATILSSLDSLILASSSAISVDLVGEKNIRLNQNNGKLIFASSVAGIGLVAAILAIYLSATVFQASLFAATVLAASIGSAMTIIILGFKHTVRSLIMAILFGLSTAILWRTLGFHNFVSDGLVGFVIAVSANYIGNRFYVSK